VAAVALVVTTPIAAEATGDSKPNHRVVAKRLNNPRQLNWSENGKKLIIAEAGRGGTDCTAEGCEGLTGSISVVNRPWRKKTFSRRVVTGFRSSASPDGSFAVGSDGADQTNDTEADTYIVSGFTVNRPPPQAGALIVGQVSGDEQFIFPFADIAAAEAAQNPDGAQIDSNPYAILFINGPNPDGYALVADAAANTVWKIVPDLSYEPPASLGCFTPAMEAPGFDFTKCFKYVITPFVTYPTTALPNGEDDPNGPPEFVPTALSLDGNGHLFVGGLGSEVPGAAQVVKYDLAGNEIRRWTGFTGVTGVTVDDEFLYVSQLFGSTAPLPEGASPAAEAPPMAGAPGEVVKTSRDVTNGPRWAIDVPLPAGLATDSKGHVFASVNSIAPAEGLTEGPFGPVDGGAVWQLDFRNAHPLS
jgi:hypothetical protein